MGDIVLETRKLMVRLGARRVLDDISLSFRKAESVVIAGRNGAGKSTFLRTLAGAIHPDRGQVIYGSGVAREKIGFISDSLSLYEEWSLEEAWRFHRSVFGIQPAKWSAIEGLKLNPKRKINRLSVGERILFHLALILAQEPAVLLVDEVIHGIDPYLRDKFLAAMIEAMDVHKTAVIMVNHTFSDTAQIPERVLIMEEGRFILDERSEALGPLVKKVFAAGDLPSGLPCLFKEESELRREYYIYPFREEWRGQYRLTFEEIGLGEIIKAFIGGSYAQKRAD
jgi:ABC-2 type transport system ATP-binding protein